MAEQHSDQQRCEVMETYIENLRGMLTDDHRRFQQACNEQSNDNQLDDEQLHDEYWSDEDDPMNDFTTLIESEKKRLRGARILSVRLSVMSRLINNIMVGWRVTGEKTGETPHEQEPNYVDQDAYQRLRKLQRPLLQDLAAAHKLIEKHDHFARQFDRKTFHDLCLCDTGTIEKCDTQSTDAACDLKYPNDNENTRSLVITMTRFTCLGWLRDMALMDQDFVNSSTEINYDDLLVFSSEEDDDDQADEICDQFQNVDAWFQPIVDLNKRLVDKYDELAALIGQPSYDKLIAVGLKLIQDADAALVKECELWNPEQE